MRRRDWQFFREMVRREIRARYLENITGLLLLLVIPLLLLAVYAFVFSYIFQLRFPGQMDTAGFLPFLAVGLWPWFAFSEAILKSSTAVTGHASLIGKIALRKELLPLVSVTATFIVHTLGYLLVLLILNLLGYEIALMYLPLAALAYLVIFLLACAIAFLLSSLQVFIKDIQNLLPPIITLWFFTTPILYSPHILPEKYQWWQYFNPLARLITFMRETLLLQQLRISGTDALMVVLILLGLILSYGFFRRLSHQFEDFL